MQRDDGVPVRETLREDRSHPPQQATQVSEFLVCHTKDIEAF